MDAVTIQQITNSKLLRTRVNFFFDCMHIIMRSSSSVLSTMLSLHKVALLR